MRLRFMDINSANEVRAESLREQFYQAKDICDWDAAREALTLMEEMKINTWNMRLEMNNAMKEEMDGVDTAIEEIPGFEGTLEEVSKLADFYTPMSAETIDRYQQQHD